VIVVGTNIDPQKLGAQSNRLREAGAVIFPNVDAAVDFIVRQMRRALVNGAVPISLDALRQPLAAINVGLESFHESLISQGAQAIHVDWRPPAGGNEKLAALLARMKK
jgi:FdrA protein